MVDSATAQAQILTIRHPFAETWVKHPSGPWFNRNLHLREDIP